MTSTPSGASRLPFPWLDLRRGTWAPPILAFIAFMVASAFISVLNAQPLYQILPLSLPGQANSNGQGISANGNVVGGTSGANGIRWSQGGGTLSLVGFAGRAFSLVQDANDAGAVVGTGATTFFGSSPLPLIWTDPMTVAQLPLPAGETLGRAFGVNNSNVAVGSVSGGNLERASIYSQMSGGSVIPETMPNGGLLRTAYAINDAGRVVGQALDPTNAAVTKGFYLDPGDATATDIGALTSLGHNSAIAFALSSNGLIAGSSSFNSGVDARAFVWSQSGGMSEVPLLPGTTTGGARGVNDSGWVVGSMSSATSIPFLYDGMDTYRLQDLLEPVSAVGWDLVGGTSNAALGIGNNGVITGRGLFQGQVTGFVMVPVPEPSWLAAGSMMVLLSCRRNRHVRCGPTKSTA